MYTAPFSLFALLRFCLLWAFVLCNTAFFGQFDKLRNYNVKDGLPSSDVYSIIQDSKGYIWITGDMGVSRFDGYKFKNFSTQNGLPDNTVFGLYEDKKHRVWFRSFSGKLSYSFNDTIYTLACNDSLSSHFIPQINNSMYVDANDTLWLGTTSGYVFKISPGWKKENIKKINIPGSGRYIFLAGKEGILYGGHDDTLSRITVMNSNAKKLFEVDPLYPLHTAARYFATRLRNGNFIATLDNLILIFNRQGISCIKKSNSTFLVITQDNDRSILAATTNGLKIFKENDLVERGSVWKLQGKVVTGVCTDKENEIWFSTEGHGIYCVPHRNFRYYTPENGMSESKISCMGTIGQHVAVGHLDGSVTIIKGDSLTSLPVRSIKNNSPLVTRIFDILNYKGVNYIGTATNSYSLQEKPHPLFGDQDLAVRQFFPANDGNIWILSYGALTKHEPKNLKKIKEIILNTRVDNFFEDARGVLWLGAMDGLYMFKDDKQVFLGAIDKKFTNRPVAIREGKNNSIWIATRGGGILLKKENITYQITEKEGLAGNMCRSIYIDSNVVWVGTNKGLSKIIETDGHFIISNFYATNGLLTDEVNHIIKYNGKLWLAHNNGLSIFDPAYTKSNHFSPPVYILQASINNKPIPYNQLSHLKYDQNYLTLDYIGLCYKDAANVEYKYRMEGVDSVWTYTRYTSITYQTLPPGTYRFVVYAKNNDGFWCTVPATLDLSVLPAWWQTWLFKIAIVISLLTLTLLVFRARLIKVRHRDNEKAFLQQRVAETELKALRAQMNPHFIFNAINSVQYFITRSDAESSQKYLAKFARLIRYVVENSKPALIPLKTELEALNLYLELESLRFEDRFYYEINIDKSVDVNNTQIPSMLIQPYVENAIWHGLMHKKGKGNIIISVTLKEKVLKCTIYDDGIGRVKSAQIKLHNPSTHKSIGMALTKERLDIINQINNTELSLVIDDLYTDQNEAAGTRVLINIPMQ
ncbi:MAG: histidine kinase [Bacteroidetes bacterium]|nr:histidine kinase [Bacteroidota bacterium]